MHPALSFFFFNDTATTEIYTLSLHDALPISRQLRTRDGVIAGRELHPGHCAHLRAGAERSEEHTSELQSQSNLVCRLLLEKKNFITSTLSETIPSQLQRTHRGRTPRFTSGLT